MLGRKRRGEDNNVNTFNMKKNELNVKEEGDLGNEMKICRLIYEALVRAENRMKKKTKIS
jgi:hypothetical protein